MDKARHRSGAWLGLTGVLAALALMVGGCGDDESSGAGGSTAAAAPAPIETIADGVLTVGSDIPFPPFEFRRRDRLTGFDIDLTEEMARRMGLKVKWVDTAFDTLFTQVAAGRFDMAASATTITPERERQVNFTAPYYAAQQTLVVNADRSPDIATVPDLGNGDVVGVQKGTTGESWARENVPDGVEIRSFQDAPDPFSALEAGAVTAVVMDEPSAVAEAGSRKALDLAQTIDTQERYGFAVDPRNKRLLEALNDSLDEILEDGTYERLYARYAALPPKGSIVGVQD
jgi:polar amino acid transport system substrate-binding protein